MNYYEWIKSLSIDDMAGVFAGFAIKTLTISANDVNKLIGAETPELPAEDKVDLFNSFKSWLESEVADEEPKAEQKIKRSECEGIDCAWCGEDCK